MAAGQGEGKRKGQGVEKYSKSHSQVPSRPPDKVVLAEAPKRGLRQSLQQGGLWREAPEFGMQTEKSCRLGMEEVSPPPPCYALNLVWGGGLPRGLP